MYLCIHLFTFLSFYASISIIFSPTLSPFRSHNVLFLHPPHEDNLSLSCTWQPQLALCSYDVTKPLSRSCTILNPLNTARRIIIVSGDIINYYYYHHYLYFSLLLIFRDPFYYLIIVLSVLFYMSYNHLCVVQCYICCMIFYNLRYDLQSAYLLFYT